MTGRSLLIASMAGVPLSRFIVDLIRLVNRFPLPVKLSVILFEHLALNSFPTFGINRMCYIRMQLSPAIIVV